MLKTYFLSVIMCFMAVSGIAQTPEDALIERGNAMREKGAYAEALKIYQEVLAKNPKNHTAYNEMGVMYYYQGDAPSAEINFRKAVELKPDYTTAFVNLANLFFKLEKFEETLVFAQKAIKISADCVDAHYVIGRVYIEQNDFLGAIAYFTKAIKIDNNYTDAYQWRGFSYHKIKKYELALIDFTRMIELSPKNALGYNERGMAQLELDLQDKAIKDFDTAIALDSKYASVINNRAYLYYKQGKTDLACAEWQKAIDLGNKNAKKFYQLYCTKTEVFIDKAVLVDNTKVSVTASSILEITGLEPNSAVSITSMKSSGVNLIIFKSSSTSSTSYTRQADENGNYKSTFGAITTKAAVDIKIEMTTAKGEKITRLFRAKIK